MAALTQVHTLNLRDNRLTGPIPEELGDLNQLDVLYLDNNQLSGPIPAELGEPQPAWMSTVRFASNQFDRMRAQRVALSRDRLGLDSLPAHDFIAVDANGNGDTADDGDTPGWGCRSAHSSC